MENIFSNEKSRDKDNTEENEEDIKSEIEKKLADIAQITRCIYCESKDIIKKGFREKKHENIQIYLCNDCGRKFTPLERLNASGIYFTKKKFTLISILSNGVYRTKVKGKEISCPLNLRWCKLL